jgi:hypothetical protein
VKIETLIQQYSEEQLKRLAAVAAHSDADLAHILGNLPDDVTIQNVSDGQLSGNYTVTFRIADRQNVAVWFQTATRSFMVGNAAGTYDRHFWTDPMLIQGLYHELKRLEQLGVYAE